MFRQGKKTQIEMKFVALMRPKPTIAIEKIRMCKHIQSRHDEAGTKD